MFLKSLISRGIVKDCTNTAVLTNLLEEQKLTFYIGIDLTADGIHIGHLSGLMLAKRLIDAGHKCLFLFGGGTTKIGDPSGKDKERPIITQDTINANKQGIIRGVEQILGKNNPAVTFVDNNDWLEKLSYIELLNEVGRHYTLAKMLGLESVKIRLDREQSISFTEFNYSILQGYDFYHLAKNYGCTLQIGGSDQWGNITSGTELVRKKLGKEVFGLTIPLLTKADGSKMGKSEGGAVWVNSDKLSDFAYFQFFRNTEDTEVKKLLQTFTMLSEEEIESLASLKGRDINKAKEVLAFEATKICRGTEAAIKCLEDAKNLFNQSENAGANQLNMQIKNIKLDAKITEVLVELGFASSNSEAKKLIAGGGVKIADESAEQVVKDIAFTLKSGTFLLKCGKKNIVKISVA